MNLATCHSPESEQVVGLYYQKSGTYFMINGILSTF